MRGWWTPALGIAALVLTGCAANGDAGSEDRSVAVSTDEDDVASQAPHTGDVLACATVGEALSAGQELGEVASTRHRDMVLNRMDEAVQTTGRAASGATTAAIREAGIEASRTWRTDDAETAWLHLSSMATSCRDVALEVEIVESEEIDPYYTAEGILCFEVEAIDSSFSRDSVDYDEKSRTGALSNREQAYFDPDTRVGRAAEEARQQSRMGTDEYNETIWPTLRDACEAWINDYYDNY